MMADNTMALRDHLNLKFHNLNFYPEVYYQIKSVNRHTKCLIAIPSAFIDG